MWHRSILETVRQERDRGLCLYGAGFWGKIGFDIFKKLGVTPLCFCDDDTVIDQIEGVNHLTPKSSYPELVVSLQSNEADAITAELPVAEGVIQANPDLTIVHFAEGKGFDIDTSVSIGLKEGSRGTEFFNQVQSALDNISDSTRNEWMTESRESAPTGE